MTFTLKYVGNVIGLPQSLVSGVDALRAVTEKLGAQPVKFPKSFYGTLHELVEEGHILGPSGGGKFVSPQKRQLLQTLDGQVAYMYIPDVENAYVDQSDRNRVHMYWCGTLTRMWNERRDDRYWGTTNPSGVFCMKNGARVKLTVCHNCYDLISNASKYGQIDEFDFQRFSDDNNRSVPPSIPDSKTGKRWWVCCKCNKKEDTFDDFVEFEHATYCRDCNVTRRKYGMLKTVGIAEWVKMGNSVNMRDKQGITPLMYVVANNPVQSLIRAMVLEYGASLTDRDNSGLTVLMHAVFRAHQFANEDAEYNEIRPIVDTLKELDQSLGLKPSIIRLTRTGHQELAANAYAQYPKLKKYLRNWYKGDKDIDPGED